MKTSTYESGRIAEEEFLRSYAHAYYWVFGKIEDDRRNDHKEGDFIAKRNEGDPPELIEIKRDNRAYGEWKIDKNNGKVRQTPTKNIPIEINHTSHGGWYEYCKENDVDWLCYMLYNSPSSRKCLGSLLFDFHTLSDFIDEHETKWGQYAVTSTNPRTGRIETAINLIIPIREIVMSNEVECWAAAPLKTGNGLCTLRL